ncbi:HD domain-containing protein [Botrimarina mediterranea]|uniref:HD domain protein n=1 Tax=Botrimarina mediterranea TaxID=2528022 RepID=A0A518K8C1_9BACT|nr:HD domain-containing protein [Botrimarina mediterranea]QDV74046.1 HD domain protein [Botrimarina mediterranea]
MKDFTRESLVHDPVHGYVPFVSVVPDGEVSERRLLDNPWLQRLRQIHQLQTAWWVYPSAEHTRFQHVIGAMHMASRAVETLYESLHDVCKGDVPSRKAVDCLCRTAALLHDVGHGPFGHFFDEHFLKPHYGLTHETLGAFIIEHELAKLLEGIYECPSGRMQAGESIDPAHVAMLIQRPKRDDSSEWPRWLVLLRSLFCGLYTVDSMDFVLRDAYMTGYSARAYDLERLLRYSFFSDRGLTIHQKGLSALIKFVQTKSELFRAVYFHRTVRAIDKTLRDIFVDSRELLFPHDPRERLDDYCRFTEWSLLIDVSRWAESSDAKKRLLAPRWERILGREVDWIAVEDRNVTYRPGESEQSSLFSDAGLLEHAIRSRLPADIEDLPMQIDLPRHIYRPDALAATAGQNYQFKPSTGKVYPLTDDQLFRQLPVAHRACRVYLQKNHPKEHAAAVGEALDALVGSRSEDDLTNM